MKNLILLILPVIAFVGGAVGGDMLHAKPEPQATEAEAHPPEEEKPKIEEAVDDWFKFPNQFFVPVMRNGITSGIMVLSLTIEMPADLRPLIEAQEHRLRDALLNALLIQANTGGFDGNFTAEPAQERLRTALLSAARAASDPGIKRVLIEDIARQEQ